MRRIPGERLRIVSSGLEAWRRGDFGATTRFLTDDAEWHPYLGGLDARVYRGPEEIAGIFRDIAQHFDLRLDFSRMEEVGECVLVHVFAHGTGVGSGVSVEENWFQLYSFRGDAISAVRAFASREEAVRAARDLSG